MVEKHPIERARVPRNPDEVTVENMYYGDGQLGLVYNFNVQNLYRTVLFYSTEHNRFLVSSYRSDYGLSPIPRPLSSKEDLNRAANFLASLQPRIHAEHLQTSAEELETIWQAAHQSLVFEAHKQVKVLRKKLEEGINELKEFETIEDQIHSIGRLIKHER